MKLVIHGELTSLNEYINKERGNRFAAATIKEKETNRVYWECRAQKIPKLKTPIILECHWFCKNLRKDADNVSFGKKFLLDGLVKARVLENDGRGKVVGFMDFFFVDMANPRVEVYLHDAKTKEKQIFGSTRERD